MLGHELAVLRRQHRRPRWEPADPGRWAIVGRFQTARSASTTASPLRSGKRPTPPGGYWQFEGRRSDHGSSDLWARFTPTSDPDQLLTAGQ